MTAAVLKAHRDPIGRAHDVLVGQEQAPGTDEDAGPRDLDSLRAWGLRHPTEPEIPCQKSQARASMWLVPRSDLHGCGLYLLYELADFVGGIGP